MNPIGLFGCYYLIIKTYKNPKEGWFFDIPFKKKKHGETRLNIGLATLAVVDRMQFQQCFFLLTNTDGAL